MDEPSARGRLQLVDVARGVAFVAMVVYHASWFATERGLLDLPIRDDLGWRWFQRSIAGTFFFLVGVSLFLANRRGIRPRPIALRLGKLGGCAAVVTAASLVLEPRWVVTFGILHCIAVCSLVGLLFMRLGWLNLVPAGVCLWLGTSFRSPRFDVWWARWTGLGTEWMPSFDFQPFFPWFGVVLLGIVAGWSAESWLRGRSMPGGLPAGLATLGRHTLLLYMAHVPVLIVGVELLALIVGV